MAGYHFFDMDGTLGEYEWWVYQTDGTYPWYENIRGLQYYRTVKPRPKAIAFAEEIASINPGRTYILTSVGIPEEEMYYGCIADKIVWAQRETPFIPADRFHVVRARRPGMGYPSKSVYAAELLGRPLTRTDYLYDDFNLNLEDWRDAGGTPVKILNGLNHARDDMRCIKL